MKTTDRTAVVVGLDVHRRFSGMARPGGFSPSRRDASSSEPHSGFLTAPASRHPRKPVWTNSTCPILIIAEPLRIAALNGFPSPASGVEPVRLHRCEIWNAVVKRL